MNDRLKDRVDEKNIVAMKVDVTSYYDTVKMAKELGNYNINVNSVCPGVVNTDMTRKTISKEQIKELADSFPLKRICEPEEIAELVLFLASDNSLFITGADIDINGGELLI